MKYHKKKNTPQTPIMLQLFSALWNEASDNEHKNTNVVDCPSSTSLSW